jgi:hypothetical protein
MGEGLAHALIGADVVIDLVNSRSFEPSAVIGILHGAPADRSYTRRP